MEIKNDSPFYLRFGLSMLSLAILSIAIYLGRHIFIPFFFSVLLSVLLLPVIRFLQKKQLSKVLSITLSLVVSLFFIGIIVYFISTQIGHFLEDIPALEKRFNQLLWSAQKWVLENFNIAIRKQNQYISDTAEQMKTESTHLVSRTFVTLTEALSYIIFLPIYTFLLLYHKEMIKRFLIEIFKDGNKEKVREVLVESQLISQQYITGLLIELCIVFLLNTTGFLILGIKYPIFLALISALLNIVPYIGMLIANIFCLIITLMTASDPSYALWVAVVLSSVQIIDNNILMPYIVGSKVKLNALAIIIGVLIAGALAGVAGMFLCIPALAVMKVIFERVDNLKPWAILLGDETTIAEENKNPIKRTLSRTRHKVQERSRTKIKSGNAR
jgi:predicted PurR-regulated permease PerM